MAATTDLEKLIATYIRQIQDLETAYGQLLTLRGLDTAFGFTLDIVGRKIGERRNGREDVPFRLGILAQRELNRSQGITNEVIAVVENSIPEPRQLVVTEDSYPAHFEIHVPETIDILGASFTTGGAEPYTLADGLTLDVQVDGGGTQVVTFNGVDFADITVATATEVAAVITAGLTGATAVKNQARVTLQSDTTGDPSSIEVVGGTAESALAFPSGLRTGPEANQDLMVQIARDMRSAKSIAVRGILFWSTNNTSFGFDGTPGALGFTQGYFASAADGA